MFSRRGPILITISLLLAVGAAWVANRWLIAQAASGDPSDRALAGRDGRDRHSARHEDRGASCRGDPDAGGYRAAGGAFHDLEAIEGKVALSEIMKGEILLGAAFADQGGGSALAAVVADNMRAVSVRVNDVVGVAGFLLPGNRVDVVAAYRDRQDALSETVVQNVKVLAIDQIGVERQERARRRARRDARSLAGRTPRSSSSRNSAVRSSSRCAIRSTKTSRRSRSRRSRCVKTKAPPPAPASQLFAARKWARKFRRLRVAKSSGDAGRIRGVREQ